MNTGPGADRARGVEECLPPRPQKRGFRAGRTSPYTGRRPFNFIGDTGLRTRAKAVSPGSTGHTETRPLQQAAAPLNTLPNLTPQTLRRTEKDAVTRPRLDQNRPDETNPGEHPRCCSPHQPLNTTYLAPLESSPTNTHKHELRKCTIAFRLTDGAPPRRSEQMMPPCVHTPSGDSTQA